MTIPEETVLGDLLPESQTTESTVEPSPFWQEQVQYIKDYTIFMTIGIGIIIGLLCALLIKRR